MEKKKQLRLEAAGFRLGNAEDFLQLSPEECDLVELRVTMSRTIRRLRLSRNLTQQELAARIHSSQSRVAKLEAGSPEVSLDLMFRGLFAVGGGLVDLIAGPRKAARTTSRKLPRKT